ncbi:MAG: hypothetical protein Q9M48_11995 [Rhodobacterales bacterium]|nr:hypothetical protein [Rhodobacterales bacterium]
MPQTIPLTAEIVTFRIIDGPSNEALLIVACGTDKIVRAAPGFISHQLSCDSVCLWSDVRYGNCDQAACR